MKKKINPECEMCGRPQVSATIKVEGALLRVCHNCTSFGNIVEDGQSARTSGGKSPRAMPKKAPIKSSGKPEPEQQILIDGYGETIKRARMKNKLTQDQLSQKSGVSQAYIRSIENENMRPTDKVAKKLEKELEIELFETPDVELLHQEKGKKKGLTVGDIVTIKHYEYD